MKAARAISLLLLAGCAEQTTPTEPPTEPAPLTALNDAQLLRRLSLDLRGVLPSEAELSELAADPTALEGMRDAWLDDPLLEDRLVSLLAERFRTRLDEFQVRYYDYRLPDSAECDFERSVGEEPLRLMARVVVEDRPWSEIVTADTTMANPILAQVWPIDWEEGAEGWQETRYNDGRPAAGILATNGLWWRYVTSKSNAGRSRAAATADLLLCADFLARPVSFTTSPSLADEDGTAAALQSEPACLACHSAVDPLAAAFFGFYPSIDYNPEELGRWHPEREAVAEDVLGVSAAWYGQPLNGLVDLGPHIAADPRFSWCAAQTFAGLLWRRPTELSDFDQIANLLEAYQDGGGTIKPLLRAITDTPEYRAGGLGPDADDGTDARERTVRLLSADQLTTAVADLTGFRWTYNDCDALANDDYGYRVLVGGVDGDKVVRPQQDPGLTWALTVKRLAQGAAVTAVEAAFAGQGAGGLLDGVDADTAPGTAAFDAAIDRIHLRLLARAPSEAERADLSSLWSEAAALGGPEAAWQVLLSAMLRDPEFVSE